MAITTTVSQAVARFQLSWWQKALLLLVLAVVVEVAGAGSRLVGLFSWGVLPVKRLSVSGLSKLYSLGDSLQKLPRATQRIQDLELRLAEASASLAELETVKRENEALRSLVSENTRLSERTLITTPVIAFAQPAIAAGERDGVQSGAVVLGSHTLLGQVSSVGRHESAVALLFETSSRPILASTENGVIGLVVGDGRKLLFTEVAKDAQLHVGDRITTVGQPQIEQGLPIGRIIRIENDPVSSAQTAIVEQAVSFFEMSIVEVR